METTVTDGVNTATYLISQDIPWEASTHDLDFSGLLSGL